MMNIKIINDVKSISKKNNNNFKVNLSKTKNIIDKRNKNKENNIEIEFKKGQMVKHIEEKIVGEIKHIGTEKVVIAWEDNTRERMNVNEAKDNLEYIDDVQDSISPLSPQRTKQEDEIESNIEKNNDNIDIEKIKMKRKIEQLEDKLTKKSSNNIKNKVADDLIDLMVSKGMIDEDDREIEKTKIIAMDDNEFNQYKDEVINYDDSHKVSSKTESYEPLTEAERALQKIKNSGGKGIIGDFSNQTNNSQITPREISANTNSSDKRALNTLKDKKFTYDSYKKNEIPSSFAEQFTNILSNKLSEQPSKKTTQNNKEIKTANKKSLPGFENLQGLTKPLQISEKSSSFPSNTSMKQLMNNLEWTTVSKIH
ncbi:MAG: hypothetical protein ACOC2W_04175 [bacterium]